MAPGKGVLGNLAPGDLTALNISQQIQQDNSVGSDDREAMKHYPF